ncbi:MAG: Wzz/FepE/Etk N-terminal domain-containing protein [Bacilli bacterium]|nr:Wzz/FepE/Etk N-terminal domain-containing protein [Bacilli bacterium]
MEEINLKEVYSYFKSRLLWMILAIVVIVIIGNIYTILTRVPMYQSNTTIVLVGESKKEYSQTDSQLNQNLIGTYSEIITSRKVLQQVIDNLKLKMTVDELSKNITTSSVEDTEIIRITVNNEKKKMAAEIANEVADVFSDEIQDIYNLENVAIIDKAEEADAPYNINYVKDNVIYLMIGVVLSFGVVFVMYYFDTTIKSSETVEEKLGLTVIGIVPKESKE